MRRDMLLVVVGLLCMLQSGSALQCWQTNPDNTTDFPLVYTRQTTQAVMERTCLNGYSCFSTVYQVSNYNMYKAGCTNQPVIPLTTTYKGNGASYMVVCNYDYCNSAAMFAPSMLLLLALSCVKQLIN